MAQWAVVIPEARLAAERLFHHETLELSDGGETAGPAEGDQVLVVAEEPAPHIVALGRITAAAGRADDDPDNADVAARGPVVVTYTRRFFDEPTRADELTLAGPLTPLDEVTFATLSTRVAPAVDNRTWLVSLDLPIEAPNAAEAVRLFWSYVMELGPRELPTYVAPSDDELAMQAFVLGEEANQDPEEDDD
ncbi:hypothetical protein Asi02nite_01860 [Asanoa siamensis]|uniref:DUF4265 domain-containing protein n=2 Tax=Asanoa siamensis TaxID=926357 RepID=A0ABQ4CHA4_9ACTN|nr:hypothetical protein [Asanoa siamensis]GIF70668.1 hypothetical protein Asi02nite_01860 [Asanoa siamensis]